MLFKKKTVKKKYKSFVFTEHMFYHQALKLLHEKYWYAN